MEAYGRVLLRCMVVSFALLMALSALRLRIQWLPMVAAMLPLIFYHFGYLARRAKEGLSSSAIDSVYYYGFLLTIGALGVSALLISAGSREGVDVWKEVAFQFGLGLVATGYAVAARIHLLAILPAFDGANAEEAIDRTVLRSQTLVSNVEMAAARFDSFAKVLIEKSASAAERNRELTEKSIREIVQAFAGEMRATTASTHQIAESMRRLAEDDSILHRHEQLSQATYKLTDAINKLLPTTEKLHQRVQAAADSTGELAEWGGVFRKEVEQVRVSAGELTGRDGALTRLAGSITLTTSELDKRLGGIVSLAEDVEQLAESIGLAVSAMKTMGTQANKASGKMVVFVEASDEIARSSETLQGNLTSMGSLAESAKSLDGSIASVAANLAPAADRFRTLAEAAEGAQTSLAAIQASAVATGNEAVSMSQTIGQLAGRVEELGRVGSALAQLGQQAGDALKSIPNSAALMEEVAKNLDVINAAALGVSGSVQKLDAGLSEASSQIQLRIRTTSDDLARDVEASSKAVDMLTGKLVDVAQIIIDRTRQASAR